MIFGRQFILQTDHKSLFQIFGSKKEISIYMVELIVFSDGHFNYNLMILRSNTSRRPNLDKWMFYQDYLVINIAEEVTASVQLETNLYSDINKSLQVSDLFQFPISFQQIEDANVMFQKVINFTLNFWPQNR